MDKEDGGVYIYIYIYTPYIPYMEYYSAKERNKTGSFIVMWMNLESVIQSEVCQKEKSKYYILMYIYVVSRKLGLMNLFAGQEERY